MARRRLKAKSTFTKKITRGPNKGDTVSFKVARGGKPFPTRVVKDVGTRSTLRNNPDVKFGKKRTTRTSKKRSSSSGGRKKR